MEPFLSATQWLPIAFPPQYHKKTGTVDTATIDKVWYLMHSEYGDDGSIEIHPPPDSVASIAANANPDPSTYWQTDYRFFDQYTMVEYPVEHIWGRAKNSQLADRLMRMNYDIHVGSIGGIPGKVLAFFVSLLIATLPVTGFVMWWGRRNKKNKTANKPGIERSQKL